MTTTNQRIYVLTTNDVVRIKALLQTVEEAVAEICDFRSIKPLNGGKESHSEDAVYKQAGGIKDVYQSLDDLF